MPGNCFDLLGHNCAGEIQGFWIGIFGVVLGSHQLCSFSFVWMHSHFDSPQPSCKGKPGGNPSHAALLAPLILHPSPPGLALSPPGMTYLILGLPGGGTNYCNPQATPNGCQTCSLPLWEHWRGIYHHLAVVGTHSLVVLGWGSALWDLWCQVSKFIVAPVWQSLPFLRSQRTSRLSLQDKRLKCPKLWCWTSNSTRCLLSVQILACFLFVAGVKLLAEDNDLSWFTCPFLFQKCKETRFSWANNALSISVFSSAEEAVT